MAQIPRVAACFVRRRLAQDAREGGVSGLVTYSALSSSTADDLLVCSFWVCEKSDGVRVLVLILAHPERGQEVYLVDRKEDYYQNFNLSFPHQDGPQYNHSNTVLDGELVIDVDPKTGNVS